MDKKEYMLRTIKKQPSQRVQLLFAVTVEFKDCGTMRLPCRAQ